MPHAGQYICCGISSGVSIALCQYITQVQLQIPQKTKRNTFDFLCCEKNQEVKEGPAPDGFQNPAIGVQILWGYVVLLLV